MNRKVLITANVVSLVLCGCSFPLQPKIYTAYQSIKIGEPLPREIEVPAGTKVNRNEFFWEASHAQGDRRSASMVRMMFALGPPICRETATIIADLDRTVLAKNYSKIQARQLWWAWWQTWRLGVEREVLSPWRLPSTGRRRPSSLQQPWSPERVASWVRAAADKKHPLPDETESILQLMQFHTEPDAGVSTLGTLGIPSGDPDTVANFVRDVGTMSRLSEHGKLRPHRIRDEPASGSPKVENVRLLGRFDGREFSYKHPSQNRRWFAPGTTTWRIRPGQGSEVLISTEDCTQGSSFLWFLADGWTGM